MDSDWEGKPDSTDAVGLPVLMGVMASSQPEGDDDKSHDRLEGLPMSGVSSPKMPDVMGIAAEVGMAMDVAAMVMAGV